MHLGTPLRSRLGARIPLRHASVKARQQRMLALLMVAPAMVLIGVFVLYPTVQTIRYSFYRWDGFAPDMTYVGLGMYHDATNLLGFSRAIHNTIIWALVALVVPPGIGLVTAALVEDTRLRPKALFRFGFFLPYFFSMAVAAAIFARVYDPSYGLIDRLLTTVGFQNVDIQWLGSMSLALPSAIAVFVWHETAFCFIIFAAAIQQLDRELYDAARADGAGGLQVFLHVTLPGLRSIATFVMMVMLIGGLTPFAVVFALTTPNLGGPFYSTEVLPTLIFKEGLQGIDVGEAAALSVILLTVVVGVTLIFMWVRERFAKAS